VSNDLKVCPDCEHLLEDCFCDEAVAAVEDEIDTNESSPLD
jgi:uncharacterized protein with PIN domain